LNPEFPLFGEIILMVGSGISLAEVEAGMCAVEQGQREKGCVERLVAEQRGQGKNQFANIGG
jgi:hypothetical protein